MELYAGHQETAGHIDSSGFEGWTIGGKAYHPISNNWILNFDGKYVPFNFDDPFMDEDLADLGYYGKIRRGIIDINVEGNSGKLQNSFHLYSNLGHHRFNDGFESHDFSYGLSSYQYFKLSKGTQLSFGLDAIHYGGKAFNTVPPGIFPRPDLHTINSLGGYLVGFYIPHSKISVQGGLRFQYTSLNINKTTPTIGLSVQPWTLLRLYANYNEAFRLPTLQELYLFPPSNPDLKPESAKSIELGAFFYFWRQDFIKIALFQNDVKNIIGLLGVPPNINYQNSGEANQSGIELQLHHQPHKQVSIRLSHSYINPDGLIAFNPKNQFKYWVAISSPQVVLSIFGKYVSDLYAANNAESRLSDYFLMNLSLDYRYRIFNFSLQFMNLLDRRYEVLVSYPAPGFHFLAGIKLSLPN
jgi:iron complex outermembrane receptor protein